MLIEQIIDYNWGAWAPWPNIYSYNWLFSWQNENLRVGYCLLLKCSQSQNSLLPPIWTKSLTIKI